MDFWTRCFLPRTVHDRSGHLGSHRLHLRPLCVEVSSFELRRYGSAGVLEQWIAEVERDVEELTDDTLSVGDIMDASLRR